MNLKEEILKADFIGNTLSAAVTIGDDKKKFAELMKFFFSAESIYSQRASWVMAHVTDKHPELITPYLDRLVKNLFNPLPDATKRSSVRLLQFIDIPERLWGEVIEICFQFISSNEAAAIKAFSMTVLFNLTKQVPDIAHELKIVIEDQIPYATPGVKNRSLKILAELEKMDFEFQVGSPPDSRTG
ncbi:MAG: hypothetical protein ABFS32_23375 [Bacteroidota bacterium]